MTAPRAASAILREARALIDKPEKWAQGAYGRDQYGRKIGGSTRRAVCFCAIGALNSSGGGRAAKDALARALPVGACVPYGRSEASVIEWNDAPGRTHAEVMDAFDRAIALAEQEEAGQ